MVCSLPFFYNQLWLRDYLPFQLGGSPLASPRQIIGKWTLKVTPH
jgi:hypothetical protein